MTNRQIENHKQWSSLLDEKACLREFSVKAFGQQRNIKLYKYYYGRKVLRDYNGDTFLVNTATASVFAQVPEQLTKVSRYGY